MRPELDSTKATAQVLLLASAGAVPAIPSTPRTTVFEGVSRLNPHVLGELCRLSLGALGLLPIACLGAALIGVSPLCSSTKTLILPAMAISVLIGVCDRRWGRQAFLGLVAGIIATAFYDVTRLTFVWLHVWDDFIPQIGRMALNDPSAHWIWGYLWRFLWNGGAMGVTFAVLPFRGWKAGMLYGLGICLCLFATLVLSKGHGPTLFPLTWVTGTLALIGHLEYGAALAKVLNWFDARSNR